MLIQRPILTGFDVSQKLLQVFKRLVKRDADAEANPEADPHRFSLSSLSDSRYLWVRMSGWILNNQEFEAETRKVSRVKNLKSES